MVDLCIGFCRENKSVKNYILYSAIIALNSELKSRLTKGRWPLELKNPGVENAYITNNKNWRHEAQGSKRLDEESD